MSERETEQEQTTVPKATPSRAAAPPVRERQAPGLTDLRLHTDTGAGRLARSTSADGFGGDRLLAGELAHVVQRRGRAVARDFLDDISSNLFGGQTEAKREPREVAVTKQDFNQILSLVSLPVELAKQKITGDADVQNAKVAAAKLGPASSALHVIATSKKEPKNRDNLYRPLDEIQAAMTTLKVMGDPDKVKDVWKRHFEGAMKVVDQVLALPIRDEAADPQQQPAASPDETLTQRDHDLMLVSLKPQLQQLIETTSGEPHVDWDPDTVIGDLTVTAALNAFSNRKLTSARLQVNLGLQAIRTFAMSLNEQQAEAIARLEAAQLALSMAMASYIESDPTDPKSPSYVPPVEPAR